MSTHRSPRQHSLRYDLHTHSTHSDGTTSPTEIAARAHALGLGGFALTDHDTAVGWDEARSAAAHYRLDFVPGMELTTRCGGRSTHLLAYGLDPSDPTLCAELTRVQQSRRTRAQTMVERLNADYPLDWEEIAGGKTESIGRPHIADALVARGYVRDRGEAFAKLLGPNSPYYEPTYAIDTAAAVAMVVAAGGVAVLAHPAAVRHRNPLGRAELTELVEAGLTGIELDHPENNPEKLPGLAALAAEFELVVTGASDYHGAGKPNRLGERTSSKSCVDRLRTGMRVKR